MKYSGIGGQAVIEGVMMKGPGEYAVSVRKPDGDIEVRLEKNHSLRDKYAVANVPVIRGVVSFLESLLTGMKTLNYSASFWEEEEEKEKEKEKQEEKREEKADQTEGAQERILGDKRESNDLVMGLVVMFAVLIAIGLFVLLPFFVSQLLSGVIHSQPILGLLEGVIRVALFVAYVKAISLMEDIRRVFMYHGAEHKCINCLENGCELTVENAMKQNMVHKRCGTSFLLVVMLVSILFFMFISVPNIWIRMILRILLIPVIAGLSYEFIIFAGKSESPVVDLLSRPGLWLQSLTTKEPEPKMIEVAIASVDAVLDWKKFLADNFPDGDETEQTEGGAEEKAGFEIVGMEDDEEEDDEILNALDRYFEGPSEKE